MTTSKQAKLHLTPQFFEQLYQDPAFRAAMREAAEKAMEYMKIGWPSSIGDELTDDSENFSHTGHHEKVFEIHELEGEDGRPICLMSVNHPYAVAHQAKTGAFTQAIKAAGFNINAPGSGG